MTEWFLGRFERNLADIRRWSIVRTTRQQSVAEHSYYVALLVPRLLRQYGFEDAETIAKATEYALMHDMSEVLTGDVATPIKKRLPPDIFDAMSTEFGMTPADPGPVIKAAVKVVDLFEASAFLAEEIAIGNGRVFDVQRVINRKLDGACAKFEKMAHEIMGKKEGQRGLYSSLSWVLHHLQHGKVDPLEPEV